MASRDFPLVSIYFYLRRVSILRPAFVLLQTFHIPKPRDGWIRRIDYQLMDQDSKVHEANMGPHFDRKNFAIWGEGTMKLHSNLSIFEDKVFVFDIFNYMDFRCDIKSIQIKM